jgi:hypothetical protein
MKKTRLLEIVREEITFALREGDAEDNAAKMAQIKATDLEIKALQKKKAELAKTGVAEIQLEGDQLNEIEQLAEMASMTQLKTQLEKQGKNDELEAVKAAERSTIDKLKQNPTFSGEGKNARLKGYVSALKKELKLTHDINLQDLLTDVMFDAEAAGDKFIDDIATNTIEKDAAAQVLGTEKGQRGRKADPSKPEKSPSTGQRGRPTGSGSDNTPKVATRTTGDDGFDQVTYSAPTKASDEEKALKSAEKTDKALGGKFAKKLSAEEEDLFKTYKKQATSIANKIEDTESTEEKTKLMGQLKSLRNNPEVAALFKAKGVSI